MFEIGFAELFLLGVIALLVVGPDRLPGLARTVGAWVGKAQRLVGQVRADIEREVRADELRRAAKEYSPTAVLSDVRKEVEDFTSELSRPAGLDEGGSKAGEPVADDARPAGTVAAATTAAAGSSEAAARKAADTAGVDEPGSTGPAEGDASGAEAPEGPSGGPAAGTVHAAGPEADAAKAPSPPGPRRAELPAAATPENGGTRREGGESASASAPGPDAAEPAEGMEGRPENAPPPTVAAGARPPRVERDERTAAP